MKYEKYLTPKEEGTLYEEYITHLLSEAKGKLRFVVITDEPETDSELFYTARRILDESGKKGYGAYAVMVDGAYIKVEDGVRTIHNADDKKGFKIQNEDTVCIIRGSITRKDSWLDLVTQMEKANICCVNSRECIEVCADKYRTYLRLNEYGLNQPKTVLIPNKGYLEQAVENLDIKKFPMILKTLRGSKGIGVVFIESERSLDAIVQLAYKSDEWAELLLQEYIETDKDIRVLVLGGKVLASMQREVIPGDFRSNFSRGGKVKKFKLTSYEIEQCILAAKAVNGVYVAVDFIPGKNRDKDQPFILEVNSSPGSEGIEKATGENVIGDMLMYFEDPKNRYSVPSEVGYKEIVTIEPFGQVIAKFDTGNSGENVIHAENMKIKGKKVTWTLNDKTITSDIIDKIKIKVGGLRDYPEERVLIHLDVEFLGTIYKDVPFTLDDREHRSPVLLERQFMSRLNVMVNPRRRYIVTTKYSL